MDRCVTSKMVTCNPVLLCREVFAARSERYNDVQSSGNESMCLVARKLMRHSDTRWIARSRRYGVNRNFIEVCGRRNFLDESMFCRPFHGVEDSRRNMRCLRDNKSRANGVIVSEEDIDDHKKVLERFFSERSGTVWDDEEVESEEISRRPLSTVTMLRLEQDSTDEKKGEDEDTSSSWWRKLNLSSRITPHTRGIILLNLLTFLYGSNVSVLKNAGAEMDPTLFSLGRFAIASLVFSPFLRTAISNKKLVNVSAELGLWASIGYIAQCIAVVTSEAARVSFISTFTVIVVPLLAGLNGAKITPITWWAAFAALVGVAFLESSGTPFAMGDIWSFVSAIMFGVHMLRTEQHSIDLLPEDTLPIIGLQMVIITFFTGMWSLATHFSAGDLSNIHAVNWPQLMQEAASFPWPAMMYTGFLTTAFCLWCELVSLRDVKATEAAVIYTLEPLWGAAFAWILMGERWGPNGWVGASFILGGCLTMQLFGHPESPSREETTPDFTIARKRVKVGKKLEIGREIPDLTKSKRP